MSRPLLLILLIAFVAIGCGDADTIKKRKTVDQIWAEALESYEDGDWTEAGALFDLIKLQYPTSQWADDAQFKLAEISYRRGEFVLAAFNYNVVRRSFPTSELAKEAGYKVGECYEQMALPSDRDQEYTIKAIQSYTDFQAIYPSDSLAMEAVKKIRELRGDLAERYLLVANHYRDNNSRKSAVIYFSLLIDEFPDTEYYEEALVEKIRLYYQMTQIDKCRAAISDYRRTVPEPTRKEEVDQMERTLP